MKITCRRLNRATLARQLLLRRESLGVPEAVRRVAALQAQEPASPYLALWNRLATFEPAELDAAFATGTVVKSSLMRLTLHAVHVDDHPLFYDAMLPSLRASRLGDRRFTDVGLTAADADAVMPDVLAFLERPRASDEVVAFLAQRLGEQGSRAWWALRTYAPLRRAPTGGPWSFAARPSFVAANSLRKPSAPGCEGTSDATRDASVRHLLLRYLQAFGPASPRDFAQFSILRSPVVKRAVAALGDLLTEVRGPDGTTLLDVAGAELPPEDAPATSRLLPMWDGVLLAYADRSRVIPEAYRPYVIRRNGDVLPTLLVDGYVAGVWRPLDGGIEATAFHPLPDGAWRELELEAAALRTFLADRDPAAYARYGSWWTKGMPGAEVRLLAS